ncbi:hypothetical protein VPH35_140292 [Triticum aestivum]
MPSWNDGDTSSEDECDITSMDMALWETPDTTVEPLFCGQLELSEPTCMMHHMRPIKCVAFEGTLTGRRFYGCPVQQSQADIIKNTRKAKKEVEQERDLLKIEKAKLEHVVNELLSDGHASKEKLEKIKAILDS